MSGNLNITIDESGKAKVNYSGDMAQMARAIIRLAKKEDEFLLSLNIGMIFLQDDLEAIRLRDEMVGIINNPE